LTGTSIVKKGRRYYVLAYMGRDPHNPRRRRYKWHGGFDRYREAAAFQATLAHHPAFSAGLGAYGRTRLRTGDYLDQWLANHANAKPLEEKTIAWYQLAIRVHLKPTLPPLPLLPMCMAFWRVSAEQLWLLALF